MRSARRVHLQVHRPAACDPNLVLVAKMVHLKVHPTKPETKCATKWIARLQLAFWKGALIDDVGRGLRQASGKLAVHLVFRLPLS
jgi:hypothetical protein